MSKKTISKMLFSSEKVELASVQELAKLVDKYYDDTGTANSIIKGLLSEARRAETKVDEAVKSATAIDKVASKVRQSVKDLGVNPSMVEELNFAERAIKEAADYKQVLSTLKKFISSI